MIDIFIGAERFRLIVMYVLKSDQPFADTAEILGELFGVEGDIDASCSFVLVYVVDDLVHLVLEVLLIALVVSD